MIQHDNLYSSQNGLIFHPYVSLSFPSIFTLASFTLLPFLNPLLPPVSLVANMILRSVRAQNRFNSHQSSLHQMYPPTIKEGRGKGCGGACVWQMELGLNQLCLVLLTMGSGVFLAKKRLGQKLQFPVGLQRVVPVWAEKRHSKYISEVTRCLPFTPISAHSLWREAVKLSPFLTLGVGASSPPSPQFYLLEAFSSCIEGIFFF